MSNMAAFVVGAVLGVALVTIVRSVLESQGGYLEADSGAWLCFAVTGGILGVVVNNLGIMKRR